MKMLQEKIATGKIKFMLSTREALKKLGEKKGNIGDHMTEIIVGAVLIVGAAGIMWGFFKEEIVVWANSLGDKISGFIDFV